MSSRSSACSAASRSACRCTAPSAAPTSPISSVPRTASFSACTTESCNADRTCPGSPASDIAEIAPGSSPYATASAAPRSPRSRRLVRTPNSSAALNASSTSSPVAVPVSTELVCARTCRSRDVASSVLDRSSCIWVNLRSALLCAMYHTSGSAFRAFGSGWAASAPARIRCALTTSSELPSWLYRCNCAGVALRVNSASRSSCAPTSWASSASSPGPKALCRNTWLSRSRCWAPRCSAAEMAPTARAVAASWGSLSWVGSASATAIRLPVTSAYRSPDS